MLRIGEQLRAPVAAGGGRVTLVLYAQFIRNQPVPFGIDVLAGDQLVATWVPRQERRWVRIPLGPLAWPRGAPLVLSAHGDHPQGALNGAILDRIEFQWR